MVPDGWKKLELNEVAPVIDCKHRTPSYSENGIPIVSPGNITWGALQLDGCRTISEIEYDSMMDHCKAELGDLVFGRNQTVGVAARVVSAERFALGQDTVLIKPKTIDSKFLQAVLESQETKRQIYKLLGGSTFGRINLKDLRQMHIVYPYMEEQQRIAEILSTWDRAIETTEKLIANSQAQKKALMQQLLTGKKRLQGFNGEWRKMKLREIVEIVYGSSPKGIADPKGQFPIIGTGGVVGRTNETTCQEPSIVIGRKGTIDRPQLVKEPFWAIDTAYFCRTNGCDLQWLYQVFLSLRWRRYNETSGVPSLSRETLYSISLSVPTRAEQIEIGQVLAAADAGINLLKQTLLNLSTQKSALMQQLLTGKRRVKIEEAAA